MIDISAYLQKYDQNLADLSAEKNLYNNVSQAYYQAIAVSINDGSEYFYHLAEF